MHSQIFQTSKLQLIVDMEYNVKNIDEHNLLLYKVVTGSKVYNTDIRTSDTDYRGVYISYYNDFIVGNYEHVINDDQNDIVYYELGFFVDLLGKSNPSVLEMLFTPDEYIIYCDNGFRELLNRRYEFITTKIKDSIVGYANQQLKKAKGKNKKVNFSNQFKVRKTPLDFCYIPYGGTYHTLSWWLNHYGTPQNYFGAYHIKSYAYTLYFDFGAFNRDYGLLETAYIYFWVFGFYNVLEFFRQIQCVRNYKGLINNDQTSNEIRRIGFISRNIPIKYFIYDEADYRHHCKVHKQYKHFIQERNEARYVRVNNEEYDGKNIMHCVRLINLCKRYIETGVFDIRVDEKEREKLLDIRFGQIDDFYGLINNIQDEILEISEEFNKLAMSESLGQDFLNNLKLKLYKQKYTYYG